MFTWLGKTFIGNFFNALSPKGGASGFFSKIKGFFSKIGGFFVKIGEKLPLLKSVFKVGMGIGRILSKFTVIIPIIMGIVQGVMGAIKGFKEDGIFGAIRGGLVGVFNGVIGDVLDLLKDMLSWVIDWAGEKFDIEWLKNVASWLDDWSFAQVLNDAIQWIGDTFSNISGWWEGLDGEGVASKLGSVMGDLLNKAKEWIMDLDWWGITKGAIRNILKMSPLNYLPGASNILDKVFDQGTNNIDFNSSFVPSPQSLVGAAGLTMAGQGSVGSISTTVNNYNTTNNTTHSAPQTTVLTPAGGVTAPETRRGNGWW